MKKSVCEEENFNTLYRDFSKQLRNFLYYKVGNIERAEDMVQDAMVKLWENCAEIAFEKAKSFLYTVCNNLFIDKVRHEKVELKFIKSAPQSLSNDPSFELEKKEFERKLEKSISDLPQTQREAFLMNRIDKMSYAEIADVLDLSVKAVEKRMHLALKNLKENVEELRIHKI